MVKGLPRIALGLLIGCCATGGAVAVLGQGSRGNAPLTMAVLSSRPDMVTGGDALIAISGSRPAASTIAVTVNGKNVAASFKPAPDGSLVGLVTDLAAVLDVRSTILVIYEVKIW